VGAVTSLLDGHSSALITRQAANIVPVPFSEIVDASTGKAQVRQVDTKTDYYRNSLALQERITAADLADPARLEKIAKAAGLSTAEAKERYAPLA
jgi:hypothetical protein